jgi:hypothetical protein
MRFLFFGIGGKDIPELTGFLPACHMFSGGCLKEMT